MDGKQLHSGHRARVKERFLTEGAESFSDQQLLELFLFYSNPRADVNPLALALLQRFGSLPAVFDASKEELTAVKGVSEHTACSILLQKEMTARLLRRRTEGMAEIRSWEDAGEYLLPLFFGAHEERVYAIYLDNRGRLLFCGQIGEGSLTAADADADLLLKYGADYCATGVILAHNHVNGLLEPSPEDIAVTARLRALLAGHGLRLVDHLILGDDDFISMARMGLTGEEGTEC